MFSSIQWIDKSDAELLLKKIPSKSSDDRLPLNQIQFWKPMFHRYSEYSIWTGVERHDMHYFKNSSDDTLSDLSNLNLMLNQSLLKEELTFYSTVTFDSNGKLRNQHPNFIATCLCKVLHFKVILCVRSGFCGDNNGGSNEAEFWKTFKFQLSLHLTDDIFIQDS